MGSSKPGSDSGECRGVYEAPAITEAQNSLHAPTRSGRNARAPRTVSAMSRLPTSWKASKSWRNRVHTHVQNDNGQCAICGDPAHTVHHYGPPPFTLMTACRICLTSLNQCPHDWNADQRIHYVQTQWRRFDRGSLHVPEENHPKPEITATLPDYGVSCPTRHPKSLRSRRKLQLDTRKRND